MRNRKKTFVKIVVAALLANFAGGAYAFVDDYLDGFPAACSEATPQMPMPGHILRLGFVSNTPMGWSFLFPEKYSRGMLERVLLLDNAGLIGQEPDADYGADIRFRTSAGQFVVAQIFVGDQNSEPVVTCVSTPVPLTQYRPDYYGSYFNWLDMSSFGTWLNYRKFGKWKWRNHWNFGNLRSKFSKFWKREGFRKFDKFKKYGRSRGDGDRRRGRLGGTRDISKRLGDFDKRLGRDRKGPITTLPVSGDKGRWRVKPTGSGKKSPDLIFKPGQTTFKPDAGSSGKRGWTKKIGQDIFGNRGQGRKTGALNQSIKSIPEIKSVFKKIDGQNSGRNSQRNFQNKRTQNDGIKN